MELLQNLLGLDLESREMSAVQICARATVVFFAALVLVRIANRRFLSKLSPLDVILGFVLASLLGRSINGSGPLLESIAAGFLLVFLHRGLAALSCRSRMVGRLVKGRPDTLVENGKIDRDALRDHNITEPDLLEGIRIAGGVDDVTDVARAILERDGNISVIRKMR